MPRRSSLEQLPERILAQVNFMLTEGKWSLDQIVDYLAKAGHPKSRSAIGRHSRNIEEYAKEIRESRQITDALVRDLGESAVQGKQGRLLVETSRAVAFELLMKVKKGDVAIEPKDLASIGKGLAEMGRALRYDQDFEEKVRAQVAREEREKAANEAADSAGAAMKEAGLSEDSVKFWREKFLGVRKPKAE